MEESATSSVLTSSHLAPLQAGMAHVDENSASFGFFF
jgi:hypothetical protein